MRSAGPAEGTPRRFDDAFADGPLVFAGHGKDREQGLVDAGDAGESGPNLLGAAGGSRQDGQGSAGRCGHHPTAVNTHLHGRAAVPRTFERRCHGDVAAEGRGGNTVDAQGVALAAIQGLHERDQAQSEQIASLEAALARLGE